MPFRSLLSSMFTRRDDSTNPSYGSSSNRGPSTRYGSSSRYESPAYSSGYTRYEAAPSSSRDYDTRQARRGAARAANTDYGGPVDYGTLGGSAYDRFGTAPSRSESTRQARSEARRAARDYGPVDLGTLGGSAYDRPSRTHGSSRARPVSPAGYQSYGQSSRYGSSGGDRLAQEASRRRHNVSPIGTSRFEQPYAGLSSRGYGRAPADPYTSSGYTRSGGRHGEYDSGYDRYY